MCAPWVLPAVGIAISAAGTGVQVAGTVAGANANAAASAEAEKAARRNSYLANLYAIDAEKRGQLGAFLVRTKGAQVMGSQRAGFSQSGAAVDSRSAESLYAQTAAMTEWDVATLRNNAAREAFGLRTQGLEFLKQGSQIRSASEANTLGSVLTGFGQGLGGAGDLFKQMRSSGLINYERQPRRYAL